MKLNHQIVILAAIVVASSSAFADQGKAPSPGGQQQGPSPEMFQKMKTRMLDNHQKRIQILQQAVTCIQGAATPDQLKSCHEQEKQAHEQLEEQNKKDRESMREQHRGGKDQGGHN
jgi:hypothetical protein